MIENKKIGMTKVSARCNENREICKKKIRLSEIIQKISLSQMKQEEDDNKTS